MRTKRLDHALLPPKVQSSRELDQKWSQDLPPGTLTRKAGVHGSMNRSSMSSMETSAVPRVDKVCSLCKAGRLV